MREKLLVFLLLVICCSACSPCRDAPVFEPIQDYVSDKDLVVKTDHHIVVVSGNSDTDYRYYVWTGDKDYSDDPDFVIDTKSN